jgi:ribosomal protein S6
MADKSVRTYELFYLVLDSKESEMGDIRKKVEEVVEGVGGTFLSEETEEKRNLAYDIRKERRGTYVARRFTLPAPGDEPFAEQTEDESVNPVEAIDRALRLLDGVARFILVRAERLPELKAIPREERPRKRRDDRRERRPKAPAPVPGREEKVEEKKKPVEKKVDQERLDKQLEEVLDI